MLSFLAIGCLTLLRLFICMHITDLCPSILSTHHSVPLKLCTISFIFAVDRLAIASRLSKQVSAVNNQIKKMLRSFNEGLPVEDHMIWEAAINIHRNSYTASLASIATSIPIEVKCEAIQKFRIAKRSLEEIALLKDEMRNCLEYYQRQIASLKRSQEEIHLQLHEQEKDVEKLSGCYCWISRKILIFSTKLTDLLSLFRNIVPGTCFSIRTYKIMCFTEVIPPSMGTSEVSTENHFPLTSYTGLLHWYFRVKLFAFFYLQIIPAHVSISIRMKLVSCFGLCSTVYACVLCMYMCVLESCLTYRWRPKCQWSSW